MNCARGWFASRTVLDRADVSNSTGNNPNGTSNWDVYTDRVSGAPLPVVLKDFSIE